MNVLFIIMWEQATNIALNLEILKWSLWYTRRLNQKHGFILHHFPLYGCDFVRSECIFIYYHINMVKPAFSSHLLGKIYWSLVTDGLQVRWPFPQSNLWRNPPTFTWHLCKYTTFTSKIFQKWSDGKCYAKAKVHSIWVTMVTSAIHHTIMLTECIQTSKLTQSVLCSSEQLWWIHTSWLCH